MRFILIGIIAAFFSASSQANCALDNWGNVSGMVSCSGKELEQRHQQFQEDIYRDQALMQQRQNQLWQYAQPPQPQAWESWDLPTAPSYDKSWMDDLPAIQPPRGMTPAETRGLTGRQPCQIWTHDGYADPDLSISVFDRACFD